ncbi:MAG: hypothetical protein GF331_06405 [Chitinivibrionales bacterium]|nr:hypothetical protein [Chitinivibrionales bacterium]
MGLWIWRHVRIEVPDDWEMLQYGRDLSDGRCAFGDRYSIRLELSWRQSGAPPDMRRTIDDYVTKLKQDEIMPDARALNRAGWHGVEGHVGGVLNTRFFRYLPSEQCVVQLVLLWPDGRDVSLEEHLLSGIGEERPINGEYRRWRAFGMDLTTREGLRLSECRIEPGNATMSFAPENKSHAQETFRRLGFVSHWLHGSVEQWLEVDAPREMRIERRETETRSGHVLVNLAGTRPSHGAARMIGKRDRIDICAWKCPHDEHLYVVRLEGESTDRRERRLAGERLRCCGGLT